MPPLLQQAGAQLWKAVQARAYSVAAASVVTAVAAVFVADQRAIQERLFRSLLANTSIAAPHPS